MSYQLHRLAVEIDTGHRLLNHPGKCGSPHGHRYAVEVMVTGGALDGVGVVVDFAVLKSELGAWIDRHWDHTFIFEQGDPLIMAMYGSEAFNVDHSGVALRPMSDSPVGVGKRPCFIMPYAPSAENIARFLYEEVCPKVFKDELAVGMFTVDHIKVWETPNCAVVFPSPARIRRNEVVALVEHEVRKRIERAPEFALVLRDMVQTQLDELDLPTLYRRVEAGVQADSIPVFSDTVPLTTERLAIADVVQCRNDLQNARAGEWILLYKGGVDGGGFRYRYMEPSAMDEEGPRWGAGVCTHSPDMTFNPPITDSHVRSLVAAGTIPRNTIEILSLPPGE